MAVHRSRLKSEISRLSHLVRVRVKLEVALVLGEVALENLEDQGFDGDRVVDGDVPHALAL
eukprot:scaffold61425_cov27-Phaeocystis_antarctica.AAC.1